MLKLPKQLNLGTAFTFYVLKNIPNELECLFVLGRPFQPSLLFVSNASTYPRVNHVKGASPRWVLVFLTRL
jgi:hypothetical protein